MASNVAPNSRTPAPRRRETMTNPKGSFIWYELITSDPDGAARCYGAVVGWTIAAHSDPAASGVDYRMFGRSDGGQSGRASCRERGWTCGLLPVVAGSIKK